MPRPTPLDLVFPRFTDSAFPAIKQAIEQKVVDPSDRDAFLLIPEAVALLQELRPEEGIGEGMDYLVALAHHAYLTWEAGSLTVPLVSQQADELLATPSPLPCTLAEVPKAYYAQFLEHQIWARVIDEGAAEPLDGCFVHTTSEGTLRVLGVFGLRPDRLGFSAAEVIGPRPSTQVRADGTPIFSSDMGTGRLYSIVGGTELLELGWRTLGPARAAWARAV